MIPTYAASTTSPALNDFKVPNDKNIIASIHAYSPYTFCGDIKSNVNSWGSAQDKSALDSEMDYYANTFRSKGIPVVMGEYGSINKNNTSSRVAHAEYYTKAALSRGIACVWWDNGQSTPNKEETFGIFDRNSLSWCQSSIKDALIRAYKAVHPNAPTPTPNPEDPTPTNPVPGNTANLKDGWYYIKNVNAQKYLQVANNTGNNGQNVELRAGSGLAGQRWYLTNLGNGYISLKSGLGNYMLDIANGKNENGANVQIYSPNSMDPQKFMLKTTSTNNTYVIATKCSNITKVLDDEKNGTTNGTNVCQWTYGGKANQQWVFEAINGSTTPTDPVPNPPATNSKLKLTYTINNWGSAYQVNFKVTNNSTSNVNGWTLKIKKSDINISSSWNVNVKEDGNYYVITPVNWNANIAKGSSVDFGVQGNGSIGSSINYELN